MEVAPDVEAEAEESSMSSSEQGRESSIDGDGKSEALAADEEHDVNRQPFSWPEFRFDLPPRKIHHFHKQYRDKTRISGNNFLKGVKWSPDGSAFLTSSDDDSLRLFYLPEGGDGGGVAQAEADVDREDSFESNLIVWEGESVYDYCWYPFMSLQDMNSCVFASTCRDHPIHLWDAFSGQLRATYRAYDAMDEITAALSVSFNTFGTKIFAGYNKCIRIFDVHRPGRDFELHSTLKGNEGLSGIVSSIGFSPSHNGLLAFGSFNQTTAVYAEGNMELLFVLHGQEGGVTQVLFSKDGNYLYTGGRKDPYILCWDIRNTAGVVYKLYRSAESTNQRISFDIEPCGRHLGTGGQDGLVHIYDLQTGQWVSGFQAAHDTVNGFSFHPSLPLAACTSGQRRFNSPEDPEEIINLRGDENCSTVWQFSRSPDVDNQHSLS
ncbi:transducin/WD40 repeat-like superfamily protein isoform X2 [Wolffia australiana]